MPTGTEPGIEPGIDQGSEHRFLGIFSHNNT